MKKIFSLFCCLTLLLGLTGFAPSNVSTSDANNSSYQAYLDLVAQNILDEDITYDCWQDMIVQSIELEKMLENSSNFSLVYDSREADTYALAPIYSMEKGDVFITNGTSIDGLTGHAGIAISSSNILHIPKPGTNPQIISLNEWNTKYTESESDNWTQVYRHYSSSIATDAADWVYDTYAYSNATYKITSDWSSTNETYCSKLVWQGYYYGPSSPSATVPQTGFILPYSLNSTILNISIIYTYE